MIYGFIIAAGNQKRFDLDIPKALVDINGKKLLELNVETMNRYCDEVFVVCSVENQTYFIENGYKKIIIESGRGSGDAVLRALLYVLLYLYSKPDDTCYIQWGDSLQDEKIFKLLKDNYRDKVLIPCTFETTPYVQILEESPQKVAVRFSKYGEQITAGYHDLSIFYGNVFTLVHYLREFRFSILQDDGSYFHKHGNEMEFLDVFNDTGIEASILNVDLKSFSFNTKEELNRLVSWQ